MQQFNFSVYSCKTTWSSSAQFERCRIISCYAEEHSNEFPVSIIHWIPNHTPHRNASIYTI